MAVPPPRKSQPRTEELGALGDAIRQLRTEAGLSQEELAERAATDLTQIGGIERGTRNPSYSTLVRVAGALTTRVGEIATLADRFVDGEAPDPG
jgi:transcriptional regulator with XRE-family HTH domain